MKKKVALPFRDDPYTLTYHNLAFPMGIIQANQTADLTPWLCGKFLNCYFEPQGINRFVYCVTTPWFLDDKMLLHQRVELTPALFDSLFGDILLFFKKMLTTGAYIHGHYNEEYIPQKSAFGKEYYYHDFLLIGYDDIKGAFVSVGYLRDGGFQRFFIPYENMRLSLQTLQTPKISFNFWKWNPCAKLSFRLSTVINGLLDYVSSAKSVKGYSQQKIWGVDALGALADFFECCLEQGRGMEMRYTRGLMEHKFFMRLRIAHFEEIGLLSNGSFLDSATQAYQLAEKVHMLGLKYGLTGRRQAADTAIAMIREIAELEKSYLPLLIDALQRAAKEEEK